MHRVITFDHDVITAMINQTSDALATAGLPCSHETAYAMLLLCADVFEDVPREIFLALAEIAWAQMHGAPEPEPEPPTAEPQN